MSCQTKAGHTFVATSPFTRAYRKKPDPAAAPRPAPPRNAAVLPPAIREKNRAAPARHRRVVGRNPTHAAEIVAASSSRRAAPPPRPARPFAARRAPRPPPRAERSPRRRPAARPPPSCPRRARKAARRAAKPRRRPFAPPRRNARHSARAAPPCPPRQARAYRRPAREDPAPAHRRPPAPAAPRRAPAEGVPPPAPRPPPGRARRAPLSRFALAKSVLGEGWSDPYRPPAGDRRPLSREFSRNSGGGVSAQKHKKRPFGAA